MSEDTSAHVSVRIVPNSTGKSLGKAGRCRSGLRSRRRPALRPEADRLRHLGTSVWRRCSAQNDEWLTENHGATGSMDANEPRAGWWTASAAFRLCAQVACGRTVNFVRRGSR
jgi:hypothetical protein